MQKNRDLEKGLRKDLEKVSIHFMFKNKDFKSFFSLGKEMEIDNNFKQVYSN